MGPFVDIAGTTTPLTGFNERDITYLTAINAGWLSYLADEGIQFVHYSVDRVKRQFGLDQDIPDDFFYYYGVSHFCSAIPMTLLFSF